VPRETAQLPIRLVFLASNKRIIGTKTQSSVPSLAFCSRSNPQLDHACPQFQPNERTVVMEKILFFNDIRLSGHATSFRLAINFVIGASFNQPAHYALHLTGPGHLRLLAENISSNKFDIKK